MNKKIRVTKDDIRNGVGTCAGTHSCPIALALRRHTGCDVSVEYSNTTLNDKGKIYRFPNSDKIKKFVDDFDTGKGVRPFTFTLDVPTE